MTTKEQVRELCKINGISIPNLEKNLGFSTGSISKWDKSSPGSDKLEKVAEYFHVSTDYLLRRTNSMYCDECGYSYNPANQSDLEKHRQFHDICSRTREMIGFLYTPSQSNTKRIMSDIFLKDNNLSDDGQAVHVEALLKADYSDFIWKNNFVIDTSYNDFCAKTLREGKYSNMISLGAKKILLGTYGVGKESLFNKRDNRDIKKDLDSIMKRLSEQEYGPAAYDGEDLSPDAADLFRDELEIALKRLKLINKEKYNPYKNKE